LSWADRNIAESYRRDKLKKTEGSTKNSKSPVYILRNIILLALIVLAAKFFFDEIPENDRIGWLERKIF
jgi:fumarate reductase subunit C